VVNLLAVGSAKASDQLCTQALSRIKHQASSIEREAERSPATAWRQTTTDYRAIDP
jgi:hypothetical protein